MYLFKIMQVLYFLFLNVIFRIVQNNYWQVVENKMKRYYARRAIGSAIQIIKTSMLRDIVVRFPAIDQQQKVVPLITYMKKETSLI